MKYDLCHKVVALHFKILIYYKHFPIFRELPTLAKHFVMRILFVEQPVPQAVVASWITTKHHEYAISA